MKTDSSSSLVYSGPVPGLCASLGETPSTRLGEIGHYRGSAICDGYKIGYKKGRLPPNEKTKGVSVHPYRGTRVQAANPELWSGPRPRRSLMVIARRLSRCCCGWVSWSKRTGGSRLGGTRSGRGRGGQPGHEGRHRRLLPPEQVDEVVEHWPVRCRSCAHVFGEPE